MGGPYGPVLVPPGPGTEPPATSNVFIDLLQKIYDLIRKTFALNASEPNIETVVLTTGGTFQQMISGTRGIKNGIIENISTENVTIVTITQNQVASTGVILTKANGAGEGGGSLPVGNVDLGKFYFVRTTAGLTLAVYYET